MAADLVNLDKAFNAALSRFMADALGGGITAFSGYRSPERQAQLFADAVKKYGSVQAARKWVAPPGKSRHGEGLAVDLRFSTPVAKQWAHQNAAKYGLTFPMSWEDWHIEPIGARGSKLASRTTSATTVDSITAALAAIRKIESSGNYKARNKYTSASGAYQFIDSTWRQAAGSLAKVYPQAWMAPAEVQDRVARTHLSSILKANNGDITLTPISWFTGKTGATARALVGSTAVPGHKSNIPVKTYQEKWLKAFEAASGQSYNFSPTTIDSGYGPSLASVTRPVGVNMGTPPSNPRAAAAFLAIGRALTTM